MKNFGEGLYLEKFISIGIHPWFILEEQLNQTYCFIENIAHQDHIIAIGECGLDRAVGVDFELQMRVFKWHIRLAERLRKPLIIHSVRAFSETLYQLKNVDVPVIIHGVNNKYQLVKPFIESGFYLSYGKSLINGNVTAAETFLHTPLNRLFLETDDVADSIENVYERAAELREISVEELKLHLHNNFKKVFNT